MTSIDDELAAARDRHQAGRIDEAEAAYRRIIERAPANAEAQHLLGLVAFGRERLDEAEACFARAVALDPSVGKYHGNLGAVLTVKRRFAEALPSLEQAVALDDTKPEMFNTLGMARREAGRVEDAIAAFRRSIALDPVYAEAHVNLIVSCAMADDPERAIDCADAAVAAVPDNAPLRNARAMILRAAGRVDEAIAELDRALTLDPEFTHARTNLERLVAERERREDRA